MSATLTLTAARAVLKSAGSVIDAAAADYGRLAVRIGIALADASDVVAAQPKALGKSFETFIDWAKSHLDVSQPRIESLARAGRVARLLKGENIDGSVSESALEQLHKLLTASDDARKGDSAEDAVRKCWRKAAGRNGKATIAACKAAVETLYPDVVGSRGPAAGSDAAAGNGKGKSRQSGNAGKSNSDRNTIAAPQPVEVPDLAVSETRLKSAALNIGKLFTDDNKSDHGSVYAVAAATIECAQRYGIAATLAAVESHKPQPVKSSNRKSSNRRKAAA